MEKKEREEFIDFLSKASEEIKSWPEWKRNALGPFKCVAEPQNTVESNFGKQLKEKYNKFQKITIEDHFKKIINMLIEESEKSVPPYKYKIKDLDYENSKILADRVKKEGLEVTIGFYELSITFKK